MRHSGLYFGQRAGGWQTSVLPVIGIAALLGFTQQAHAIVYRDDVSDALSRGLSNQNQFSATGQVYNGANNEFGTGTLVLNDWVLTAKHVVAGYTTATFNGVTGTVYADPNSDVALIHLNSSINNMAIIAPGFLGGEVGKMVWLAGYGGYSTTSGQGSVSYDLKLRAGTNVVREYNGGLLYFDNANTGSTSSVYESSTAPGDSGGPMYQQIGNVWYVVGETYGANGSGFVHTPTNPQKSFILSTIRTQKNDQTFNFTTAAAPTAMTWDADVTTDGLNDGAGTWDIQRTNFYSATTGFNYQWDNAMNNDITFGSNKAAAGIVTIKATNVTSGTKIDGTAGPTYSASGVTAHNVTFNAAASGTYEIASSASAPLTLASTVAGDPIITANVDALISAPITGTSATISKAGTGTLTLSGANSYTGKMQVTAGTLVATQASTLAGYNAANHVSVASADELDVNAGATSSNSWTSAEISSLVTNASFATGSTFGIDTTSATSGFTYSSAAPTNASLEKLGANTLTLSAAQNYIGGTAITAGTLALAGSGRLPTATTVSFANNATLSIGTGVNQTLAAIAAPATSATAIITGAGTLTAGAGMSLGSGNSNTFDLSGLSNFTFNQSATAFAINGNSTTTKLAAATSITGSAFNVGTGNDGSSTNTTTNVTLGKATTLNVDSIQIGNYHATANITGSAPSGATFTLHGQAGGTSRADVIVGFDSAGAQSQAGTLDLRGSTLDARVDDLTVASYAPSSGSATATGMFAMSVGTLDANTITVALNRSTSGAAGTTSGTVNQEGGTVRTGSLSLGSIGTVVSGQTSTAQTATYNLGTSSSAGTLQATTIGTGTVTSNAANTTATRTINWNNGTIQNYNDGAGALTNLSISGASSTSSGLVNINLASTGTHTFYADTAKTITVQSFAILGGTGGTLAKDGDGTLKLLGAESYTGATHVAVGLLTVNGSLANSAVTIDSTASLGGTGMLNGLVTSSGILAPGDGGAGKLTLAGGLQLMSNSSLAFDLGTSRDLISVTNLTLGSGVKLNLNMLAGFGAGTYSLLDYSSIASSGLLSTWTATGLSAGYSYRFALGTDSANANASAVQFVVTAVPEPAAIGALLTAASLLLQRRRSAAA